ncbi:hypothetical protein [Deinococcus humi]|uniref:Uncharacterized protein n=1 Tax=Deinococcus humi TaxID=662880 RepID=A0A7W8JQL6_9DEIO|nr:hypothetical protein [Deinococcus humi]MBB5361324.1 hypothetical protein [Deinococcus humi]GGO19482.1 hypothetical protein GCM10008949_03890 [Deinococcus humi]
MSQHSEKLPDGSTVTYASYAANWPEKKAAVQIMPRIMRSEGTRRVEYELFINGVRTPHAGCEVVEVNGIPTLHLSLIDWDFGMGEK